MKIRLTVAMLLLVFGVGLCVRMAFRAPEGQTVVACSEDVQSAVSEVFTSLLSSKSKGGWKGTKPYWETFPSKKRQHLYQKLIFTDKKAKFTPTDAIEVPGGAGEVILHGSFSNGIGVAVHFVKQGGEYKIKSIEKHN